MRLFSIAFIVLFLTACSDRQIAQEYPQIPSYAISQNEKTTLGNILKKDARRHRGESGFHILPTGSESFAMRLALIRAADKTIDLQYFSINDDTTSNLLLEALIQAANRGVRVRFLLDSIDFDAVSSTFAVLDSIDNIEIRVFNPFAERNQGPFAKVINEVTDLDKLDHRMHNKMMIVDNQASIIGGRNLGDEYFEENSDVTFRDLDMLTAGPIVAQQSRSFDRYWNDQNSKPMGRLHKPHYNTPKAVAIRAALAYHWDEVLQAEKGRKVLEDGLSERIIQYGLPLDWAKAEFVADSPRKINHPVDEENSRPMNLLEQMSSRAKNEFIIVSPYFVPRKNGVEWLTSLKKRGVNVKVLTNSLASTDMVSAYTGYKKCREALVDNGIELYELKPIDGKRPRQRLIGRKAPARAMLHAKLYVTDQSDVMVGSFNLDPRSIDINTELAMEIHSPAIAKEVIGMFNHAIDPRTSYHVVKTPNGLVWKDTGKQGDIRFDSDPHAGFWRIIEVGFLSLLPIENQL